MARHGRAFPSRSINNRRLRIRSTDTCPAGPYYPTILANVATGDVAWTNPANAQYADDAYATSITVVQTTQQLWATGLGFQIVTGQTIDGIVVECEAKVLLGTATVLCRAIKGGSISATSKSGSWTTSEGQVSYGGAADLWGETWTAEDINAANFGVMVRQEAALSSTLSLDAVRVTVYCSSSAAVRTRSLTMTGVGS